MPKPSRFSKDSPKALESICIYSRQIPPGIKNNTLAIIIIIRIITYSSLYIYFSFGIYFGWGGILQATDTEQAAITVIGPNYSINAIHFPAVVVVAVIVLGGTPPIAKISAIVEIATRIAVTARQSGKSVLILTVA